MTWASAVTGDQGSRHDAALHLQFRQNKSQQWREPLLAYSHWQYGCQAQIQNKTEYKAYCSLRHKTRSFEHTLLLFTKIWLCRYAQGLIFWLLDTFVSAPVTGNEKIFLALRVWGVISNYLISSRTDKLNIMVFFVWAVAMQRWLLCLMSLAGSVWKGHMSSCSDIIHSAAGMRRTGTAICLWAGRSTVCCHYSRDLLLSRISFSPAITSICFTISLGDDSMAGMAVVSIQVGCMVWMQEEAASSLIMPISHGRL